MELAYGRTNQKVRTRNALLAAARDLIAKGLSPTVEDAAEASAISRTTAYRYFKNQAELLAAAHPEIHVASLLPANAPEDPETRLDMVVKELTHRVIGNESQYRTMLRLSLEEERAKDSLVLRRGRAIGWIEDALAPIRATLGKTQFRRLVLAIRASVGIEALVWLTDIAGLTRDEAAKNMQWSARALLRSALAERAERARG
jgi:AcrR family transcriptional regulator